MSDPNVSPQNPKAVRLDDGQDYHLISGSRFTLCGIDVTDKDHNIGERPPESSVFKPCLECEFIEPPRSMHDICKEVGKYCKFEPVDPGTGLRKHEMYEVLRTLESLTTHLELWESEGTHPLEQSKHK